MCRRGRESDDGDVCALTSSTIRFCFTLFITCGCSISIFSLRKVALRSKSSLAPSMLCNQRVAIQQGGVASR